LYLLLLLLVLLLLVPLMALRALGLCASGSKSVPTSHLPDCSLKLTKTIHSTGAAQLIHCTSPSHPVRTAATTLLSLLLM
jgi:hypothetical protein